LAEKGEEDGDSEEEAEEEEEEEEEGDDIDAVLAEEFEVGFMGNLWSSSSLCSHFVYFCNYILSYTN